MTLVAATLESELLKLFDSSSASFVGYPTTAIAAANNWANAYDAYAKTAMDMSGDLLVTANKAGFASTLISQLPTDPTVGSYVNAANAFDAAFIIYWTAAIFAFIPPEASSIVTVIVPSTLANLLLPTFSDITAAGTAQIKAQQMAAAFHAATTTAVTVTISYVVGPAVLSKLF